MNVVSYSFKSLWIFLNLPENPVAYVSKPPPPQVTWLVVATECLGAGTQASDHKFMALSRISRWSHHCLIFQEMPQFRSFCGICSSLAIPLLLLPPRDPFLSQL